METTTDTLNLARNDMVDVVVDIWRIRRRAKREENTPPAVRLACETAMERLIDIGFRIDELVGQPYDENARIKVVHRDDGVENQRISECVSPAVYFKEELIKPAEVILEREESNETTNS